MIEYRCHDICCDNCIVDFYNLIDIMIKDIQFLQAKAVYLRLLLSRTLPEYDGWLLRNDIFTDLAGCYWDNPAYKRFMEEFHSGLDPMDDEGHYKHITRIRHGEESVRL